MFFMTFPKLKPPKASILLSAKFNVSNAGNETGGKSGIIFCPRFHVLSEDNPSNANPNKNYGGESVPSPLVLPVVLLMIC
jgi:hypothetical protein